MAAISPIINQETFELKGFLLLDIPFNLEFTDQIKEKSKTDIMVYVQGRPVTSTLTDSNGEMVFPNPAKGQSRRNGPLPAGRRPLSSRRLRRG